MARLDLEITDKMMERLQKKAGALAVEPSDVAKTIISHALASEDKPGWADALSTIVSRVSEIVTAVSHVKAEKPEE